MDGLVMELIDAVKLLDEHLKKVKTNKKKSNSKIYKALDLIINKYKY